MPDQPIAREREAHPSKHRPPEETGAAEAAAAYAELRCLTNFSFLRGASHPDELADRAWRLGYRALAVTDVNSLAGVVRAHVEAKTHGFKLLIGAELVLEDFPVPVVVWAPDRAAYGQLSRLLTVGRQRVKKGECRLLWKDLERFGGGLLAGLPLREVLDRSTPGASRPEDFGQPADAVRDSPGVFGRSDVERLRETRRRRGTASPEVSAGGAPGVVTQFADLFGDRGYALVELRHGPDDRLDLERMLDLADAAGLTAVACGGALYHDRDRRPLHDVLTATRLKKPVAELMEHLPSNGQRHLKTTEELTAQFAAHPELLARTVEVADRCTFSLDDLRYEYPREIAPDGLTLTQYLRRETYAGVEDRYPDGLPEKVERQIEFELQLIEEQRYEAFFLTVYDAVKFARSRGILCQGRGSAANSAVCFCLHITEIDPAQSNLLFERFLSTARDEAPDIDVDFEHERREEVIQYLYAKYGRHRTGIAAAVATYRPRSAIRDIGKALGLSLDRVDRLAKHVGRWKMEVRMAEAFEDAGMHPGSRTCRQIEWLMSHLLGFPRHLSQHSGGMVMTDGRLDESVPIENAAMPGRTVVQWDKDDLAALGMLKVDVLALGMLTAMKRCFALITKHYRPIAKPSDIPHGDRATYRMIQAADTMGVFQIESRAQMSMLPRLRPKCFYDLVIEVAIVRPGPIQGDMVHPYLRRREGVEEVTYPSEEVKGVLGRTLGVPIFQEQAMELAKVAAGFTADEADQFRRAIGAWRSTGLIDSFEQRLKRGLDSKGYSGEFADRLFQQIRGFGEYGFPESHAASFAILVYASCWIKCHYPAAFCAALLNSQPMGFYQPAQLVSDARGHGVRVRPADVNHSDWDCTLEPLRGRVVKQEIKRQTQGRLGEGGDQCAVRLGLRMIRGFGEADALRVERARLDGPFGTYAEFCRRTGLQGRALRKLADAGALKSLDLGRREGAWASRPDGKPTPLLPAADEPIPELPRMSDAAEVTADYRTTGLSLRGHPVAFLRESLKARGVVTAEDLKSIGANVEVAVAGLVLLRQQPGSAHGVVFMTLEDETGPINLIFWPDVWQKWHRVARVAGGLIARGPVQRQRGVIHVLVRSVEDLSDGTAELRQKSKDFQ